MLRPNSYTTRPHLGARFALGKTFVTPGAQEALEIAGETAIQFLRRHMSANWGEMVRFVTIAILVREYPQDIMIYLTKEFSK